MLFLRPGPRAAICTYCTKYLATQLSLDVLRPRKGDPNGPLIFIQPCGAFYYSRPGSRTRADQRFLSLDPGSTCKFVNIYPRPPVASYSNPKDSISSSPAFLYCIMCTCICFMLFRSTCSWPFSEENPLRVASEALNIHLVSCILYWNVPLDTGEGGKDGKVLHYEWRKSELP